MNNFRFNAVGSTSIPVYLVDSGTDLAEAEGISPSAATWMSNTGFSAKAGTVSLIPGENGAISAVFVGRENANDFWSVGALPSALPEGDYHLASPLPDEQHRLCALAWGLGCYQFTAYKMALPLKAVLTVNPAWQAQLEAMVSSIYLVRDLINTPAEDMGPEALADAVVHVADECGAKTRLWVGEALLANRFAMVHAVGRAAVQAPRLVELSWGDPKHPTLALVGKGVCFDSGGLDIKSAKGMEDMKKDMGGAAHALALARLIMLHDLPVHLRLMIPCVENAVSANSYRPRDVLTARDGTTVEVLNTDAEGRLILADALCAQVENAPDLLIDFATLTGAARVALGTEVPALMTNQPELAKAVLQCAEDHRDPIATLPLYQPYQALLKSELADISNCAMTPYGGAITAGLFLQHFVPNDVPWLHFDIMASNPKGQPGRPVGGEAQSLRALLAFCQSRYS